MERILKSKGIFAYSHRGGQKEKWENSISAFKNSISLGVWGLELDVFRTRCGRLVISHDPNLIRTTGQDILIQDIDYKDIGPYLDVIHDNWSDVDDLFVNKEREKPPLLIDLVKIVKGTKAMLNIDLKSNSINDFRHVCEVLIEHGMENQAVIGGFDGSKCRQKMQELRIKIPMFFDIKECVIFFLSTFFGLLPFVRFNNDILMIPHYFKNFVQSRIYKQNLVAKIIGFIFWIESFYFRFVTWHMNRRGIPVVFWVLNTEEDFQKGLDMGANGLMTDFPTKLKQFLMAKNLFEN